MVKTSKAVHMYLIIQPTSYIYVLFAYIFGLPSLRTSSFNFLIGYCALKFNIHTCIKGIAP